MRCAVAYTAEVDFEGVFRFSLFPLHSHPSASPTRGRHANRNRANRPCIARCSLRFRASHHHNLMPTLTPSVVAIRRVATCRPSCRVHCPSPPCMLRPPFGCCLRCAPPLLFPRSAPLRLDVRLLPHGQRCLSGCIISGPKPTRFCRPSVAADAHIHRRRAARKLLELRPCRRLKSQ